MNDTERLAKYKNQAEMLSNKVRKRYKHLKKRFAKQQIDVYRLYDWDIPEIRAVVDWYDGHLVIGEYTRMQSTAEWLPMMGEKVAEALDVPMEKLHLKERKAGKKEGKRYERIDFTNKKIVVSERDLKFLVNPYDFVDTGLFSDHRNTRQMIRQMVSGKEFLNLYCYTGAFTCYAARGGAKSTVSVDRSKLAIKWARENFALNKISEKENLLIQSHTEDFLKRAYQDNMRFDLAVVDPPSYSTTKSRNNEFNILTDHPGILRGVIRLMRKGGTIFFSTNHQSFEPSFDKLNVTNIEEITSETIPEDYINKRKTIHRCFRMTV